MFRILGIGAGDGGAAPRSGEGLGVAGRRRGRPSKLGELISALIGVCNPEKGLDEVMGGRGDADGMLGVGSIDVMRAAGFWAMRG